MKNYPYKTKCDRTNKHDASFHKQSFKYNEKKYECNVEDDIEKQLEDYFTSNNIILISKDNDINIIYYKHMIKYYSSKVVNEIKKFFIITKNNQKKLFWSGWCF